MASSSSVLSEEQFLCSICLDVFTEPVSVPCGHNFCKACIRTYWDSKDLCQCPICKKTFDKRPDLFINTFISEMADHFRKSVRKSNSNENIHDNLSGDVSCDVCTGTKLKALKSCLVCMTSYCETHLEPHHIAPALKKHKLINPVENLEDRMCKKHDRPLELFCRIDQMCLCVLCSEHMSHQIVPLEEEYVEKMSRLGKAKAEIQQMIQERLQKVQEIKRSVELSRKDAERQISDSVEVFTVLLRSIERSQAELLEVIQEKQTAAERQAEGLIKELEQEVTDLKRRCSDLEQLSHTEDHHHLLQSFTSLCTPPPTNDWSEVSVPSDLFVQGTVRRAVSQLEETVVREVSMLCDAELKKLHQYEVDVTLDTDTAHRKLILSDDEKQVKHGDKKQNVPDDLKRFNDAVCVLGTESFSGRFYYEVVVKGKTDWTLGVATESVNRKGRITLSPENGCWAVWLRNGYEYEALTDHIVTLFLRQKPQKVGVFVDYEEGLVSFYDVEARSQIYSFTGCSYTEKLYPYFSPGLNDGGKNSAPLIISTVNCEFLLM